MTKKKKSNLKQLPRRSKVPKKTPARKRAGVAVSKPKKGVAKNAKRKSVQVAKPKRRRVAKNSKPTRTAKPLAKKQSKKPVAKKRTSKLAPRSRTKGARVSGYSYRSKSGKLIRVKGYARRAVKPVRYSKSWGRKVTKKSEVKIIEVSRSNPDVGIQKGETLTIFKEKNVIVRGFNVRDDGDLEDFLPEKARAGMIASSVEFFQSYGAGVYHLKARYTSPGMGDKWIALARRRVESLDSLIQMSQDFALTFSEFMGEYMLTGLSEFTLKEFQIEFFP